MLIACLHRNLQKKEKKAKYERGKVYMESLRDVGNVMEEYAGDGRGDVYKPLYQLIWKAEMLISSFL